MNLRSKHNISQGALMDAYEQVIACKKIIDCTGLPIDMQIRIQEGGATLRNFDVTEEYLSIFLNEMITFVNGKE